MQCTGKNNLYKKSDGCPIQNYKMRLSVAICNFIKTYIFSIRQIKKTGSIPKPSLYDIKSKG